MSTLSIGISDSGLALGNYHPDLKHSIQHGSGKFGALRHIAQVPGLARRLRSYGMIVDAVNHEVLSPGDAPSDGFFDSIDVGARRIPEEFQRHLIGNNTFHVRGGSPGDFKGLVDVLPTQVIHHATRERIKSAIDAIRSHAHEHTADIQRYAQGEGVYWDPQNIQIGVVPSFDIPILTVTEDPNNPDTLFLDTLYPTLDGGRNMSMQTYTHNESAGMFYPQQGRSQYDESYHGFNLYRSIQILKEEVLDQNMTYQFELGWIQEAGRFLLLQVKEFAKKNPINTALVIDDINHRVGMPGIYLTRGQISRVVAGFKEGETLELPIVDGKFRWNILSTVKHRDTSGGFVARPESNSDALDAKDYDAHMKGFFHGDVWGGTFAHNSFRFAQSVVRKGGIYIAGHSDRYNNTPGIEKLQMKVIDKTLQLVGDSGMYELPDPDICFPELKMPEISTITGDSKEHGVPKKYFTRK